MSDDVAEVDPFELEQDPDLEEFNKEHGINERVAVIRTSDRNNFRKCRRRWNWQSHLRGNLAPIHTASPLWYGSGMHYALEDFHGERRWPTAKEAFRQYVQATRRAARHDPRLLPPDFLDLTALGYGMLEYYTDVWLVARDPLKTFVYEGVPQVEVHAVVEVPIKTKHYERVLYAVTLDRVVEDYNGGLWILDYKSAKRFVTTHFANDPQISSYCWVGSQLYPGRKIEGFIYQQHRKDVPTPPKILSDGTISTAKTQLTTHRLYRKALKELYGDVIKAPKANLEFLNAINAKETENADYFVRRDKVYRNEFQIQAEGAKLMMELEEMLNPDLPLYPSPSRDCQHMCSFAHPCISLDDGGDWAYELEIGYRTRDADFDHWRKFLPAREAA